MNPNSRPASVLSKVIDLFRQKQPGRAQAATEGKLADRPDWLKAYEAECFLNHDRIADAIERGLSIRLAVEKRPAKPKKVKRLRKPGTAPKASTTDGHVVKPLRLVPPDEPVSGAAYKRTEQGASEPIAVLDHLADFWNTRHATVVCSGGPRYRIADLAGLVEVVELQVADGGRS